MTAVCQGNYSMVKCGKKKKSALKPKKRFKDTMKYYVKQSELSVDQWGKWLQIEVAETDSRKHRIL